MIILVEGADCTGKSTLVERLAKSLIHGYDVEILHAKKPTSESILWQYLVPLQSALRERSALVIDRWHPGELVYGPSRRGGSRLSPGQFEYVELVMRSIGFVGVLCDRSDDELAACLERRGDDEAELTTDQLQTDAAAFRAVLANRHNWVTYDPGWVRSPSDEVSVLTDIISRVTPLAPFVRAPVVGAYVGHRRPRALLVGDRRNPTDQHEPLPWPFVPWTSTSGLWMFDSLVANDVPLQELGVINGCERTPTELHAAWVALGHPPTVALGVNAAKALAEAFVPITARTAHPQWWRRFKHREGAAFAAVIREAMR